jgi:hypothetical protein
VTPRARLRLARLIVEEGWPIARAAERYEVSWPTAKRWAERYRLHGAAGMTDRSSRPHRSPAKTSQPVVRKIVHVRLKQRLCPVQIAGRLGMPASTVHAVLRRCRLNRLSYIERGTGEQIRRYEHDRPGAMLHVDVKKFGNIPDGGGWRYVGRVQGERNREATANRTGNRNTRYEPRLGTAFVHTVIDDHTRLAYAEIRDDEKAATAIEVLREDPALPPPRPAERSNVSTAPLLTAGRWAASTAQNTPAAKPSQPGSTSTITTDPTPQPAADHPSPA